MKIQRSALTDGVAILTLKGDFDAFSANPFLEQIEAGLQGGATNYVVNLRLVLFINSTAIGSLIKARKRMRGLGGDLVISEPSQRVKEALDALGLSQVIHTFRNDDEAVRHLAQTSEDSVEVPSDNVVLLRFSDPAKDKAFSDAGKVARMAALEEGGIHFFASGGVSLYASGTDLKVKFRLPLFRRSYYFDIPCRVKSAQAEGKESRVFAEFVEIHDEDRKSIAQFLRDMRLLKDEIRELK